MSSRELFVCKSLPSPEEVTVSSIINFYDVIEDLAEDDDTAAIVLRMVLDRGNDFMLTFCHRLVAMNIRGRQISIGYENACDNNLELFINRLMDSDLSLIDIINGFCPELSARVYAGAF